MSAVVLFFESGHVLQLLDCVVRHGFLKVEVLDVHVFAVGRQGLRRQLRNSSNHGTKEILISCNPTHVSWARKSKSD